MEYLPCEMIEHIFSFLPYDDHLRATEVCSRWKEIFETRVINDTLLTISNKHRDEEAQNAFNCAIRKLSNSTRVYHDLKLVAIDFATIERSTEIQLSVMIANVGINVTNLTLEDCRLSYGKLLMIVQLLKRSETICIDSCRIFHDSIPAPELMLKVENIRKVSILDIETEDVSSVTSLLIQSNSADIDLKMEYGCIDRKVELVEDNASRIKKLSCMYNETRIIRRIFGCAALDLESLKLQRNPNAEMHYLTYRETVATQTNLRELFITMPISLRILADISRNLTALEILRVKIDDYDAYESIPYKWPKLKTLEMILDGEADIILNEMEFQNQLEELRLHVRRITKYTMMHIYEKCKGLKILTVAALSVLRGENMLGSIGERLPHLSEIELQCGSRTTFVPFFESAASLKNLTTLVLTYCNFITNKTLANVTLPYLRKLVIIQNLKITKEGLQNLLTNCPKITTLILRGCNGTDDEAVQVIASCLPRLEYLDISESPRITLNSIRFIFEGCRFMKDLNVDDCSRLLIEWRLAPSYIHSFYELKKYYYTYPEYFYSYLAMEPKDEYDSDYCYYEGDTSGDLSDIGDFVDDYEPVNNEPGDPIDNQPNQIDDIDHIIVISDDE